MEPTKKESQPVLWASFFQRRKTIETLTEESRANANFYIFLSFSAFISALGLLLDNPIVIVGAMLIAPILFPILSFGMGIVTSSRDAIMRSLKILWRAILVVFGVSFVTAFVVNEREVTEQLLLSSTPNFLFFLVAFFSGGIASFSWVKQNAPNILPGVAITVSLLPPLSAVGISVSLFSRDLFAGGLLLFVINLLGIVLSSIVIFSLFGFSRDQDIQEEEIEEEKKEVKKEEPIINPSLEKSTIDEHE